MLFFRVEMGDAAIRLFMKYYFVIISFKVHYKGKEWSGPILAILGIRLLLITGLIQGG